MTTRTFAANTTLETVKKEAKRFLKAVRSGDLDARSRVVAYFADVSAIGLQDVHLILAREHGFRSWSQLKAHLQSKSITAVTGSLPDRILSLAMVSYFADVPADPTRFAAAKTLLGQHPELAEDSIYMAATLGDAAGVTKWLGKMPELLDQKGGPFKWPPLLYAAYARIPDRSSLPAGRSLIEAGANPNAFFMDDGQYRFTALTGVFGEGEAGKVRQPAHPDYTEFAKLLLDAGAEANDSQALYNRMFEPDETCLRLLLKYGLTATDKNNWLAREDGNLIENSQTVFDYQLAWALQNRMPERVRLLVEHGASVERAVKGRSPYEWALLGGDGALAEYLLDHGASAVDLQPEDQAYLQIVDLSAPLERVLEKIQQTTTIEAIQRKHRTMMHDAAGANETSKVLRMLRLGFDPNAMTSRTSLHEAALHGHIDMAQTLIENGALTTLRDPHHYAPPIGWAEYNGHTEMVEFLSRHSLDVFAAAAFGQIDQLQRHIEEDETWLEARFGDHRPRGRADPSRDWLTPLGFAILNGRLSAASYLIERGASVQTENEAGRGYRELASGTEDEDLVRLIDSASRR
jgi:ankyrin repeat protein